VAAGRELRLGKRGSSVVGNNGRGCTGKKSIGSFDLEFKLKVLEYAREHSGEAAARKFGIDV